MFIASMILLGMGALGTTIGGVLLVGWIIKKIAELGD